MPARRDPVARFLEKIDWPEHPDGCWLWNAGLRSTGYGQFCYPGHRTGKAHRFAYELWVGPIGRGLGVLHRCDNPPCVNPDHLFLGTHEDNMRDMGQKGRHFTPFIEMERPKKLSPEQEGEVRSLYVKGSRDFGLVSLGKMYGVSYTTIWKIVSAAACKTELAQSFRRAA